MTLVDLVARIVLATLVGGAIGLERELRDHNAGFRTHILVCIGSAAFTLISAYGFEGIHSATGPGIAVDPSRVAAQIVTGIGFLGAGAIIREGPNVRGLTTAASLWAVSALGMAIGLGLYAVTLVTAAAVLISLSLLRVIERRIIDPRVSPTVRLDIRFSATGMGALTLLVHALDSAGVVVENMEVVTDDPNVRALRLHVRPPKDLSRGQLRRLIEDLDVVGDLDME